MLSVLLDAVKTYGPLLALAGGLLGYLFSIENRLAHVEEGQGFTKTHLDQIEHRLERMEDKIDRILERQYVQTR